ncbi:MAG: NAD-dependent epimerase/dehydratase family protein [Candidatus Kapabacteria bacterium]|nr:NAD-dependent epimerase/dehydratase family protein [Candidatus Kapabacteria bacterium]
MKVLLTGATGFVGSHIADTLLERGHAVRANIRKSSNLRWLDGKPIELVDASLSDVGSLENAVAGVDAVIHCAGLTAARNAEEFMQGNKGGTENILRAVMAANPTLKKFVHISSLAAVGPAESRQSPVNEQTAFHPITPYGESKRAAEEVVLTHRDVLPVSIVRPPAVYGERDEAIYTFFQTVNKGIAPLIGFSEKWISLVHVTDLARGIVQVMESPAATGNTYFISSDEFYTWEQISAVTARVLKKNTITLKIPHSVVMSIAGVSEFFGRFSAKPPVLNFEKGKDITQEFWICSTDAARRDVGYTQQVSLEDGVRRTTDWYKQHGWL